MRTSELSYLQLSGRAQALSEAVLPREMLERMGLPLVDESILALAETFFQRLEESGAPG